MRRPLLVAVLLLVSLASCGDDEPEATPVRTDAPAACDPYLQVYFRPGTRADVLRRMEDELRVLPGVRDVEPVDQESTLVEFTELFAESPQLLDAVEAEDLPPRLEVTVTGLDQRSDVEATVRRSDRFRQIVVPVGTSQNPRPDGPAPGWCVDPLDEEPEVFSEAVLCRGPAMTIYYEADFDEERLEAAGEELAGLPEVTAVTVLDQDDAYEEFVELFADSPNLVEQLEPDHLPASIRVEMVDAPPAERAANASKVEQVARASGPLREIITLQDMAEAAGTDCP